MYLALVVTARCNAACTHCSTSCGPQRTESLPRARILSLMDEAAELSRQTKDEWLHFSITGGEPFLDFDLLLEAVRHGHQLGAEVSCVSNAYWASSDDKARSLLEQLQEAGLDLLAVSTSRFHQQFVKRSRVERALRAAREIGLRSQVKVVRTGSDAETAEELTAWAHGLDAGVVQFLPLAPWLRKTASLPDEEFIATDPLPQAPCPASLVSIEPTGAAFSCCTPGATTSFFSLGDVHTSSLAEIRDRFHLGGKQQILREHGPVYFARKVQQHGHSARLRQSYGDVCQLCTHVASDPVMAPIAEAASREFELQQLHDILGRAVVPKPRVDQASSNQGEVTSHE